jgi:hypothetical protein
VANKEALRILKQGSEAWNKWRKADLKADLSGADLTQASLIAARLSGANLSRAVLRRADLRWADLSGADLSGAHLSGAHLSEAPLRKANLSDADLRTANLRRANLSEADLRWANLSEADLSEADLSGAVLIAANLRGADLRRADLSGAHLSGAVLRRADLRGANLTRAEVGDTLFVDIDLSKVVGLESVRHHGPSNIGIDTIYKSQGKIPEIFLHGAGVPEPFIVQMKALVGSMEPIQFYSCFISYSFDDQHFADRLHADLQVNNVRCWFAGHDMKGGKKIHEQIDEAIRLHDKVLLILSEASMASEWVKTEIAKARRREVKERKRILFPIRLVDFDKLQDWENFDADTGKDSAREIREYFIPDFSRWKDHDSYRISFDRLLRDLKASA